MEYSTLEPWQRVNANGVVFDQGSLMAFFYDLLGLTQQRGAPEESHLRVIDGKRERGALSPFPGRGLSIPWRGCRARFAGGAQGEQ